MPRLSTPLRFVFFGCKTVDKDLEGVMYRVLCNMNLQ